MAEKHIHIHLGAAPRKAAAKDAMTHRGFELAKDPASGKFYAKKNPTGGSFQNPPTKEFFNSLEELKRKLDGFFTDTKDAASRAELEQKLRVAQGRYDKLETGVPLREKVALKQQIDDLKKQLAETKDAAPTESQFKAKVSEINQLLTDASRRCEQLAGQLDAGSLLEKCDKLEDLIDKARNYAFQIR